jgi:hypothetical protein
MQLPPWRRALRALHVARPGMPGLRLARGGTVMSGIDLADVAIPAATFAIGFAVERMTRALPHWRDRIAMRLRWWRTRRNGRLGRGYSGPPPPVHLNCRCSARPGDPT